MRGDFPDEWAERWLRIGGFRFPVPAYAGRLAYTLGGIAFVGLLLLFLSGLALTLLYDPRPDQAHPSIRTLMDDVPAGGFIRSFHYWGGQAVILVLILHLLRVFVSGAYKFPRILTWYAGVALFLTVVMGSYFSGTVLKWDQEGAEALEHYGASVDLFGPIGSLLTEGTPGSAPLILRFFAFHIAWAPLLILFLVACHFYLIHAFNLSPRAGGPFADLPELPPAELTATFTDHIRSIFLFSGVLYGTAVVLALLSPAPLGEEPGETMTGVKPPWPFLWLYGVENMTDMRGILYGTVGLTLLLCLVPLLDRGPSREFRRRKGILAGGIVVGSILVALSLYAWIAPARVHGGHEHHHPPETMEPDHSHHSHGEE